MGTEFDDLPSLAALVCALLAELVNAYLRISKRKEAFIHAKELLQLTDNKSALLP